MKKSVFLLTAILFSTAAILAQEVKKPKIKLSQFQISMGGDRALAPLTWTQEDFNLLAPGAQWPTGAVPYRNQFGWDAATLNINVAFHPLKKNEDERNMNRLIRAGISAQGVSASIYNTSSSMTTRVDTLVSSSTGNIYGFVDSIRQNFTYGSYNSTAVKADFAYLGYTDISKRISFYSGIGASFGITIAPRTQVQSHAWNSERITDTTGNFISSQSFSNGFDVNRESYRNKMGYLATAYVPLGIDFRLGKKNEFMKQMHLFFELRPTVSALNIPEIRTFVYPSLQNSIGVKFEW